MKGEGPCHDEHGGCVNVLEGQVAHELGFDYGADVREVCAKMVYAGDCGARGDGRLDLG